MDDQTNPPQQPQGFMGKMRGLIQNVKRRSSFSEGRVQRTYDFDDPVGDYTGSFGAARKLHWDDEPLPAPVTTSGGGASMTAGPLPASPASTTADDTRLPDYRRDMPSLFAKVVHDHQTNVGAGSMGRSMSTSGGTSSVGAPPPSSLVRHHSGTESRIPWQHAIMQVDFLEASGASLGATASIDVEDARAPFAGAPVASGRRGSGQWAADSVQAAMAAHRSQQDRDGNGPSSAPSSSSSSAAR
jgi:hypothetical protein